MNNYELALSQGALHRLFDAFERTHRVPTALFTPQFFHQVSEADVHAVLHRIHRRYGNFVGLDSTHPRSARFQRGQVGITYGLGGTGLIELFSLSQPAPPPRPRIVSTFLLGLQAALAVCLPLLAVWTVVQSPGQPTRLLMALPLMAITLYAVLSVAWAQTSVYLQRYVLLSLFILAMLALWPGPPEASPFNPDLALRLPLTILFSGLSVWAWLGRRLPSGAVELGFPLRGHTFAVIQGGSTRLLNYHVTNPHMRYALDIVAVDRWGRRAAGLFPTSLSQYTVYGCAVVSPCDAVVLALADQGQDLIPPQTDPSAPAGNHVLLGQGDMKILLAHLQSGSICVEIGQYVTRGQSLGRVGNSGNSSEPHLHIHVERGGRPDRAGTGLAVPAQFEGRTLFRGSLIRALE